ncbi:hypothetical protein HOG98_04555 [bacterium]|nr:hypothetical protein [bacterium]
MISAQKGLDSRGTSLEKMKPKLEGFQADGKDMLDNSGNREVQEENTSGWGYKLKGAVGESNTEKMFAGLYGVSKELQGALINGFSGLFGA